MTHRGSKARVWAGVVTGLVTVGIAIVVTPLGSARLTAQQPAAQTARVAPRATNGGAELFRNTCQVCHGEAGIGNIGPALRGAKFTAPFVRGVMSEGRPGTLMPEFKTRFTGAQIDQVAGYVASLQSPIGPAPAGPTPTGPAPTGPTPTGLHGDPAAGEDVFFTPRVARSCHWCHSVNGRGGRVGPDLAAKVTPMTPREIFQKIVVVPHRSADPAYATTRLRTRGGQLLIGIRAGETDEAVHFYDTSSLPPILRTIPKAEIIESQRHNGAMMPSDFASRLTLQQLLDVIAFLKSATGSQAPVTLNDVLN